MHHLFLVIISYLVGNFSAARYISKLFRLPDPTKSGSKNPGTTNVLRSGGLKPAILTFLLDCLKGILMAFLCKNSIHSPLWQTFGISAVVLGHVYPILYKFTGGKGVATALGAVLIISPPTAITLLILWGIIVYFTKLVSLGSITIAVCAPLITIYYKLQPAYLWSTNIIAIILLIRHYDNIKRLLLNKEKKIF